MPACNLFQRRSSTLLPDHSRPLTNWRNPGKIELMNLDRRLIKQANFVKLALSAAVLGGFLAGLAAVLQARQVSQVISRVFLGGQSLAQVRPWLWGLLAILVARALFNYMSERSAISAAQQVKQHLRNQFARHLFALGPAYTQAERSGELINTATQGIEALDAYFSQYLPQLILAGMLPVAFLAVIFPLDPLSGLVLLLTGPLIPVFMFLIGSAAQSLTQRQWQALGRMSAYFFDTLQGLTTLKALGRSQDQGERIERVSEQYRDTTLQVLRVTFLSALVLELLSTIGTAIIAVEIGLRLLYGHMGFESAFFILLLAPDFYLPLRALGLRFHASMAGVAAARRIFSVLEQPLPAVPQVENPRSIPLRSPFEIDFQNVTYTYPNRSQPAIENACFSLLPGQTTALVGSSGAGKSTLAALLLGFAVPDCGIIRVNGIPLSELFIEDWRKQIAWVPQQPYLFHGTLADNLRIARSEASLGELRKAAEQAHLAEWIEQLPQGYDTPVGEDGARISGGQAQRLALARAFLRDAPFLILDEPTAHLDVALERQLQETTRRLCQGRTVLVIAHRLPTVVAADQIIVVEAGQVVENGSHVELLARSGAYVHLLAAYQGGRS